ncbi:MAG: GWxTD domain-containing protein [Chitinophagales bacterium]|nr:GWxTD domain-containing protein [Chitinophagaceae bacterium]MCB9063641.1 GWxTD domain-containing protein [Chitinophagales bacterium]
MTRRIGLCLILLFIGNVVYGISALTNHKIFFAPKNNTSNIEPYIELYWQIDPNTVQFKKNELNYWVGKVRTEITLSNEEGVIAEKKYFLQTPKAIDLRAATIQNITDLQRFSLPKGKAWITLKLSSEDGSGVFEQTDSVTVPADTNTILYSDLQLIDTSYKASVSESILLKNHNIQVPLCADFLDDHRKLLHYYFELYNTNTADKESMPLVQEIFVSKKAFDYPIYSLKHRDTLAAAQVLPMLGSFKIDVLPSGNYHLNVMLTDNSGKEITRKALFFQRSNLNPIVIKDTTSDTGQVFEEVNVFDLSSTFVSKYNAAQLMAILKMLLPISSPNEQENINSFLKKPDITYMRYFIYNFWKARNDQSPDDAWKDYTKLVKEVNKNYGNSMTPGYETDRGFIQLKYGEPDQRYVVSNEEGALPYEVWQYNAPGQQGNQGAFLFYNPGFMITEYRLLHSTVIGEVRNTNWRSQLYKMGVSTNNLNSRAEQVFQNK